MNPPRKPSILSRPVPAWAMLLAVLIACGASGMFAFAVSFFLFKTGIIATDQQLQQLGPPPGPPAGQGAGQPPR
jgi:hypothetical protein